MVDKLKNDLKALSEPGRAESSAWFFKTGPGQYGEGDRFLGVRVPDQRSVAKKYIDLPLSDLETLLASKWHEERLTALIIMVNQFKKADETKRRELYNFYLGHTERINNWDLVDTSARDIVGGYIFTHQELLPMLDTLSNSSLLWERRIAVLASFYFINQAEPDVSIQLAKKLLQDKEDLMQKAVGWMLRELGKRCDQQLLLDFLDQHAQDMPRTMLRYSIEHLPQTTRKRYLAQQAPR